MQKHQVLAIIGCVMVLAATATEWSLGKVPIARPHRVAVESFPLRVGSWVAGPKLAVDSSVREKLSKATIIEHVYTNSQGQSIDCMLVTATDSENLHDPAMCFPAQGWRLSNTGTAEVAGQPMNIMEASLDQQDMTVRYWLTGYYPPPPPRNIIIQTLAVVRSHLIPKRAGMSLFVRLMAPNSAPGQQSLSDFTREILPQIKSLTDAAAKNGATQQSES